MYLWTIQTFACVSYRWINTSNSACSHALLRHSLMFLHYSCHFCPYALTLIAHNNSIHYHPLIVDLQQHITFKLCKHAVREGKSNHTLFDTWHWPYLHPTPTSMCSFLIGLHLVCPWSSPESKFRPWTFPNWTKVQSQVYPRTRTKPKVSFLVYLSDLISECV